MGERRYPLQALSEATGLTEAALSRRVGLSGSTLKRARSCGLTEPAADRYAVRAGLHPEEVWSGFGLPLCEDCGEPFAGSRRTQRFCSLPCRRRSAQRRWRNHRYQTDPEFAEKVKAKRRAFYQECREYELARQRRYDRERRARAGAAA